MSMQCDILADEGLQYFSELIATEMVNVHLYFIVVSCIPIDNS